MNRESDRKSRSNFTPDELDEFAVARRARRAKNSRWKRPRRILGLWSRLALLAGVIVVSVFLAIGLVAKAIKPYREAGVQSAQLRETQAESDALAADNTVLARRIAYLKTPDGVASEARKMGYLRPGEVPIVVEGLPGQAVISDTSPVSVVAPASPPTGNAARRFWRHLTGH